MHTVEDDIESCEYPSYVSCDTIVFKIPIIDLWLFVIDVFRQAMWSIYVVLRTCLLSICHMQHPFIQRDMRRQVKCVQEFHWIA